MFKKYRKKGNIPVQAVQLDLANLICMFTKWGAEQRVRSGDWLVLNDSDTYTVNEQSFADTYVPDPVLPGHYIKTATIEAEQQTDAGRVITKKGTSGYLPMDYIVRNGPGDCYAVRMDKFEDMYEEVED